MTAKNRNAVIIVVVAVVVVAVGIRQARKSAGKIREVSATLTHIDLTTRTAAAEVVHAETGGAMEISGVVPADCEITINGKPAKLEDLRVKDRGVIRGRVESDTPDASGKPRKKVVPVAIHVTRTGDAPQESKRIPVGNEPPKEESPD